MKTCCTHLIVSVVIYYFFTAIGLLAQTKTTNDDLLKKYIASKNYDNTIVFDASDIKRYWIDNSVIAKDNLINIQLNLNPKTHLYESKPFLIQLINVQENQDCRLDLFTDLSDLSFSINNSKGTIISSSVQEETFIQKHIYSSVFHLEDTQNFFTLPTSKGFSPCFAVFNIVFRSKTLSEISINKIILSFSTNKSSTFLSSPGTFKYTQNDILTEGQSVKLNSVSSANPNDNYTFSLNFKTCLLKSNNKFYVLDNTIKNSIKLKNIGTESIGVFFGYAPFTKDGRNIHNRNNPYKTNKIVKVISAQNNSNRIVVDSYPEWAEKCYLAFNAKEDLSDFPNFLLSEGSIQAINKLENGHAEILLSTPITSEIKAGTPVRIQSPFSSRFLYTHQQISLQPGEEIVLSSSLQKDDNFLQFSQKAFCKGTYYVIPILSLTSKSEKKEASVLISDFEITY